ncbi:hypothetical protein [Burkholderia ubonensis]|uniref:hypothetical protein n=1 Tax=Burkholderia ubonensis TaxID=101571 RepID=UPI000B289419|nr:hypothetical protein [Burkholderia ubonensis]
MKALPLLLKISANRFQLNRDNAIDEPSAEDALPIVFDDRLGANIDGWTRKTAVSRETTDDE